MYISPEEYYKNKEKESKVETHQKIIVGVFAVIALLFIIFV